MNYVREYNISYGKGHHQAAGMDLFDIDAAVCGVYMFNILGVGDGARLTVASKNELLEARKEAVQTSIEPR